MLNIQNMVTTNGKFYINNVCKFVSYEKVDVVIKRASNSYTRDMSTLMTVTKTLQQSYITVT